MTILKPRPCGLVPTKLDVSDGSTYRWRYVSGDCGCGWMIEAGRMDYMETEEKVYAVSVDCWNDMPRGPENNQKIG